MDKNNAFDLIGTLEEEEHSTGYVEQYDNVTPPVEIPSDIQNHLEEENKVSYRGMPTADEDSAMSVIDNYWRNQQEKVEGGQSFYTITNPNQLNEIEYNKKLFFERVEAEGILTDEIRPVLEGEGNKLMVACAGAGKTTVVVLDELYDYLVGRKIKPIYHTEADGTQTVVYVPKRTFISTFLSSGAKDIKDTFINWAQTLGVGLAPLNFISFSTLHAEVKAALGVMGLKPALLQNEQLNELLRSIMMNMNIRNKSSYSNKPSVDEIRDVSGIVTYARNILDNKKYLHQLSIDYALDKTTTDELLFQFKKRKASLNAMDFDDLQEELLTGLQTNQAVVDFIMSRYDSIVVDEFQDTSQLQYGYLVYYFAGYKDVTVVGDDDQIIYSWRGSDIDIILNRFLIDLKPSVYHLTRNFRCGNVILEAVIPSIVKNKKRFEKTLRAHKQGGEINLLYELTAEELTKQIITYVSEKNTVGIIARVNDDLIMPAISLELEGKVSYRVSKGVSLRRGYVNQVLSMMDLVTSRYNENFGTLLKTFLPFKQQKEADLINRVLKTNNDVSLKVIPENELNQSVPNLAPVLIGIQQHLVAGNAREAYMFILRYLKEQVFISDKRYHVSASEFISYLTDLLTKNEKIAEMDMFELSDLFRTVLPTKIDKRIGYSTDTTVVLTTVHDAKGKEWDAVYIWNDIENVFPTKLNRAMTDDEFEEERRAHYIAWTRAKKVLNVVTKQGKESIFLLECDLSKAGVNFREREDFVAGESSRTISLTSKNSSTSNAVNVSKLLKDYRQMIISYDSDTEEYINFHVVASKYDYLDGEMLDMLIDKYYAKLQDVHLTTNVGIHRHGKMMEVFDSAFKLEADRIYGRV